MTHDEWLACECGCARWTTCPLGRRRGDRLHDVGGLQIECRADISAGRALKPGSPTTRLHHTTLHQPSPAAAVGMRVRHCRHVICVCVCVWLPFRGARILPVLWQRCMHVPVFAISTQCTHTSDNKRCYNKRYRQIALIRKTCCGCSVLLPV